ncbi:hypothetical protein D3C87_1062240 [compost metagenome]
MTYLGRGDGLYELGGEQRIALHAFINDKTRRHRAKRDGHGTNHRHADQRKPAQQVERLLARAQAQIALLDRKRFRLHVHGGDFSIRPYRVIAHGWGFARLRGYRPDKAAQTSTNPCGSEPAREGGRSVDIFVTGSPLSRAGSLPQWPGSLTGFVFTEETCGSELAREGGGSVDIFVTGHPHSRAGSLPQVLHLTDVQCHPHRPRFWGMTPFPRWPKTPTSHLQTPLIRPSAAHSPHLGMEGVQALCN